MSLGCLVFGLASLACGLASTGAWLIAARSVQGLGGAILFTVSVAMIASSFPPAERGRAFGIQTAVGGTFIALGPLIGGFFTDIVSWRWVFWVNIPVLVAIFAIVRKAWKPQPRDRERPSFDFRGLLALVVGLGALVLGLMQGPDWGWSTPPVVALLVGGLVGIGLFSVLELRAPPPHFRLFADFRVISRGEWTGSMGAVRPQTPHRSPRQAFGGNMGGGIGRVTFSR